MDDCADNYPGPFRAHSGCREMDFPTPAQTSVFHYQPEDALWPLGAIAERPATSLSTSVQDPESSLDTVVNSGRL